jgi:hypothetical protein
MLLLDLNENNDQEDYTGTKREELPLTSGVLEVGVIADG